MPWTWRFGHFPIGTPLKNVLQFSLSYIGIPLQFHVLDKIALWADLDRNCNTFFSFHSSDGPTQRTIKIVICSMFRVFVSLETYFLLNLIYVALKNTFHPVCRVGIHGWWMKKSDPISWTIRLAWYLWAHFLADSEVPFFSKNHWAYKECVTVSMIYLALKKHFPQCLTQSKLQHILLASKCPSYRKVWSLVHCTTK